MSVGRSVGGLVLGAVSIALVAGWFSYETLVMKGLDAAETRQLILIALAVLAVLLLGASARRPRVSR